MKNVHVIVQFHEGGFFSNFNKVTTFLKNTKDNIVKITWDLQGQPYGAFAYNCGEVFGKLFENYNTGELVDEIYYLQTYTDLSYTGKEIHNKYNLINWRVEFNKTLKFFKPTSFLQKQIDALDSNPIFNISNLIGILKRNNRLKCEQHDNKLPTLEEYYTEIDKYFTDNTYLYLAVDNIHDLNSFIGKYKKCIYNTKSRRTNFDTDEEPHFTPGTAEDARNTYLEVYTLSKCNYFIHPLSNMSTAVLYFNPNIKSIYI